MPIHSRNIVKLAALLLLVTILVCSGWVQGTAYAALPATSCSSTGPGAVTCELFAKPGTITLPGTPGTVTIWGYSATSGGNPEMPGPVLIVNQGDEVTVHLTNNLVEATGLNFVGVDMIPDFSGVGAGEDKNYVFTASQPGTFLYEAGLLPNTQHQVAMGLFGVLVVRPVATNQAYDDAISTFDDESLVVLSELDPKLNNSANPATFDMRGYKPTYSMINGQVNPNTLPIPAVADSAHLLRYANAGLQPHPMGALGLRQLEIAVDGSPYAFPRSVVAEIIAPGQTADMLLAIPALAPTQAAKYAIYDTSMTLHNNNAGFGGMLTFLSIDPGGSPADTTGPETSQITLTPDRTAGLIDPVVIAATVNDVGSVANNVVEAEYFIDTVGTNGNGVEMTGAFNSPSVAVQGSIAVADLALLSSGSHTIYIHGLDDAGNWGPTNFAVLNLDKTGPKSSGLGLTPNPSNGTVNVVLTATGNDSASGNSYIAEAQYVISDSTNLNVAFTGSMLLNKTDAHIASLSVDIPQADINSLEHGVYLVTVRSKDDLGNWGAMSQAIPLFVDKIGPSASAGAPPVNPSPNNGKLAVSSSQAAVRVNATLSEEDILAQFGYVSDAPQIFGEIVVFLPSISGGNASAAETVSSGINIYLPSVAGGSAIAADAESNVVEGEASIAVSSCRLCVRKAEAFIDTPGTPGTGVQFTANDGLFDELVEPANLLIPLLNLAPLSDGPHTIYVRGQDGAGNWGDPPLELTLVIDRQAPTLSDLTASFDSNSNLLINFTASDSSGIGAAEYFIDATGATGTGIAMTVNGSAVNATILATTVAALAPGNHTLYVHARDTAGNWSTFANTIFVNDRIFASSFESNDFAGWTSRSTQNAVRLTVNTSAAMVGTYGMQARADGSNYAQYQFGPSATAYDARFYFNPQNATTATNTRDIFVASSNNNFNTNNNAGILFRVVYRRVTNGQTQVQVVLGTGGVNASNWQTINATSANVIEVVWQASTSSVPGSLQLIVNGAATPNTPITVPTNPNRNRNGVVAIRLGSVSGGGNGTQMYFDAFASKRSATPLFGP